MTPDHLPLPALSPNGGCDGLDCLNSDSLRLNPGPTGRIREVVINEYLACERRRPTMSTLVVEVCEVKAVYPHPQADALEFITVKGWQVIVQKVLGLKVGQRVV